MSLYWGRLIIRATLVKVPRKSRTIEISSDEMPHIRHTEAYRLFIDTERSNNPIKLTIFLWVLVSHIHTYITAQG